MPTATIEKSLIFTEGSGKIGNIISAISNSTETAIYCTNNSTTIAGSIYKIDLPGFINPTVVTPIASIVSASAITISPNDQTLYILTTTGKIYEVPVTTGIPTQIGDLASINSGGWESMALSRVYQPNCLLVAARSLSKIWSFNLNSRTTTVEGQYPFRVGGFRLSPSEDILYISASIPGESRIVRKILAQGRWELVAGNGISALTDGEALKVASFKSAFKLDVTTDNKIYCNSSGGKLRLIEGGTVSSFANVSTAYLNALKVLRNSGKIVVSTAANTLALVSIT